jgi:hypothetical protein
LGQGTKAKTKPSYLINDEPAEMRPQLQVSTLALLSANQASGG